MGPTHPYTGGIAHHTTELAHRLARGARVDLLSWAAQFPLCLYPGDPLVPWDRPEMPVFPATRRTLSWFRPDTWWREGRRLRSQDVVVLVVANPLQVLPYRTMLRAAGGGVRRVAVVHNVLPHERGPTDRVLMRWMLRCVDRVVVHSQDQARLARATGATVTEVRVAELPPHFPRADGPGAPAHAGDDTVLRLLFFGTVRRYKGLDLLLAAMAQVPQARLVVAGEFWEPLDGYRRTAVRAGVDDRVDWRPGYVPAAEVAGLFAAADVVVLPYRSGTASQNVAMAGAYGVPVVVTDAGTLATGVRHGHDGLVVPAGDLAGLAEALTLVADPRVRTTLQGNTSRLQADHDDRADHQWHGYAAAVLDEDAATAPAAGDALTRPAWTHG